MTKKTQLHNFFLQETQFLETYTAGMKKEFEAGNYVTARHFAVEVASRAASMNGTLATLDQLKE